MLNSMALRILCLAGALLLSHSPAQARLNVFACEPEWAALTQELGGDRVAVYSATTALQDPHHVQARPSLIAQLRQADLLVCTGADLEAGWLPVLLRQAANTRVQPGMPGHFSAADFVQMREAATRLDRADGDIHAHGNPHIHTDPRNITGIAQALAERLISLDAAHADVYSARHQDFSARWLAAIADWEKRAAPLRGIAIVVQHKSWTYLQDWLGLIEVATLEPKPGLPPTSAHLAEVLAQLRQQPARMVIRAAYQDDRSSTWLQQQTGITRVELPFTVGGNAAATDLFTLFDDTLTRLLAAGE